MMLNHRINVLVIIFSLALFNCTSNEKNKIRQSTNLYQLVSSKHSNVDFINSVQEDSIHNMVDFFYVYNGGGVAIGDLNNDNLPDLYFTGNMVNDRVYINQGDLKFQDITISAGINLDGWSTGVTMVDINHDGLLDIYVCRSGNYKEEDRKNLLYINQGNLTFKDQAAQYGLADTSYSTQASFFDYDNDGDLDMYLLNHSNEIKDPNNIRPTINDGTGPANDRLFKNMEIESSKIHFIDVTVEAGITFDGMGLGIGINDFNNDGWQDIFVTNDFMASDYLYKNNKDGTFKEVASSYLDHTSHFSMGHDIADFNNDGLLDIVVADMLPPDNFHLKKMAGPLNYDVFKETLKKGFLPQYMRNTLQLNNGLSSTDLKKFSEIGQLAGIDASDWSWSPLFLDFDNDGQKDLFITNGYLRDVTDLDFINYTANMAGMVDMDSLNQILRQKSSMMPSLNIPNFFFKNIGNYQFIRSNGEWELNHPSLSNGASYADLDNDGDLDIVCNNINQKAFIYENHSSEYTENHFVQIKLKGPKTNLNAVGAEVSIYQGKNKQVLIQNNSRGYQSSVSNILHFGLGQEEKIDSILVKWPNTSYSLIKYPKSNNQIIISHEQSLQREIKDESEDNQGYLVDITKELSLQFEHGDLEYNDFNRQFLLPHKHSNQGPSLAVGDLNGDQLEDFVVGGSYGKSATLFFRCHLENLAKYQLPVT